MVCNCFVCIDLIKSYTFTNATESTKEKIPNEKQKKNNRFANCIISFVYNERKQIRR